MMEKDLDYYMSLPYTITVIPDPQSGGYVAKINELPGCITQAESLPELMNMIQDAKRCWLDGALQEGIEIPEPIDLTDAEPSKFLLRLPKSLQRDLAARAKLEGVSLNQYMLYQLARSVGPTSMQGPAQDEMAATVIG
ncbi:type II toxin-antitoxin system HicB family antitoxin [Alicyclobacillus curvatus]|nr:type II toxin-antitoxin system HicB family antitoxin [Alicyclobacillus curvatus]